MKLYSWLYPHFMQLITNYQTKRWHHALIIQSFPGMGDESLINAIAHFMMCKEPQSYTSCNECNNCKLMQANVHPDYYILVPEETKNLIGIDTIREINDKLYKKLYLGVNKLIWLTNADLLTEAAANALLKILEEPPEKTYFIFSYYGIKHLPTTLRSRCRIHYLAAPQESESLAWLSHKVTTSQEIVLTSLRLYSGAPLAALNFLKSGAYSKRKLLCRQISIAIENSDWLSLLTILNCDSVPEYLQWLISLLIDALKIRQDISLISNIDNQFLINMLAQKISDVILLAIIHDICHCRKQMLNIARH